MKYKKIDTYSIDILKFRDIDNSDYLKRIATDEFDIIKENFPCCIKDVHEEFQRVRSIVLRLLRSTDIKEKFKELYQNTINLLKNSEEDLENFEKDAFHEIERYASKEHVKNDVFEIILLRKKLFIQLFNHVCILFKGKRLLKRINESYKKLEAKEHKVSLHKKGSRLQPAKLEYATSTPKTKEQGEEPVKMSPEKPYKHFSLNDEGEAADNDNMTQAYKISNREMPDFLEAEPDIHSGKYSFSLFNIELVQEKRPRKASIEVIDEEKEDLMEPTELSKEIAHSTVGAEKEINSEVNEIATDVKISISNYNTEDRQNYTEEVESIDQLQQLEDIQTVLHGNEKDFMNSESFSKIKQGIISLD